MAKRPASLIYGLDERPPFAVLLLLAVQHIFLMSSSLVLPVVLVREIGGSFNEVRSVVASTMIACGIGTIVQAFQWRIIGSGYLCPNLCGPNFFAVSMQSAWLGGLPLMRGMTIAAGVVEVLFSRVVNRVKFLFPPEITGLVVLMVAISVVPLSASKLLGINFKGEPIDGTNLLVAGLTLLVMVGVNVWGKGKLRLYSVLFGMFCGYLLSMATGLLEKGQFETVATTQWFALPFLEDGMKFSFQWSLLPAFAIVSITGALKSIGNLIMCEMINDDEWREPNMRRIGDGLTADSIAVAVSGLLGGMASDTSASNVALSKASGATSRWIGFAAGGLFIALGFSPTLSSILALMPMPVMGAILVFVTSFMIMSAFQIMMSAKPDTGKTFVLGVSIIFGLSLDILPDLYTGVHPWLRPLFESSLTFATVLAVTLNQLLRIGSKKQQPADAVPKD
jgi:xanthine permease XanP